MADVVIKNWDDVEITYTGVESLTVITPEDERVIYTQGELGEDITADADFSGGDMVLERADGNFIRRATVTKPVNLVPGNIMKDVEIAGVIGTAEGSGGGIPEGDLLKYTIYQIDEENKEIILYKILYDELYALNGNYEVVIPNQIGSYGIVIASEGAPN